MTADVFGPVSAALPGVVFFPEHAAFSTYTVAAPLVDDWGGAPHATSPAVDYTY